MQNYSLASLNLFITARIAKRAKFMFSQVFVILSLNRGGREVLQHQRPLDNTSPPPPPGHGHNTPLPPGTRWTTPPPPYGQCAGGTHPTGMHSCRLNVCYVHLMLALSTE